VSLLDAEDLLLVARRTLPEVRVRDLGLLAAAAARPYASAFGQDAYPSVHLKAAALVQSLAKDHPLVDGGKRLALASLITFLGLHGLRLTLDNDAAYDLIIAIVVDELADVASIAALLRAGTAPS
jgi:death-on-curing protein